MLVMDSNLRILQGLFLVSAAWAVVRGAQAYVRAAYPVELLLTV
jgi:hypothetical protein